MGARASDLRGMYVVAGGVVLFGRWCTWSATVDLLGMMAVNLVKQGEVAAMDSPEGVLAVVLVWSGVASQVIYW